MNKALKQFTVFSVGALVLAGCAPLATDTQVVETDTAVSQEATDQVRDAAETEASTNTDQVAPIAAEDIQAGAATQTETETLLVFLVEEEKLAHDVYTALYEAWGSNAFGNILESESTHQDKVMELLDLFGVADPRSSEVGVFQDQDLQALYNQLIAKGLQSAQDAFEVGVIIEEKDIKDISFQLENESNPVVVTVLESLRAGSENHLRAFNRQVG